MELKQMQLQNPCFIGSLLWVRSEKDRYGKWEVDIKIFTRLGCCICMYKFEDLEALMDTSETHPMFIRKPTWARQWRYTMLIRKCIWAHQGPNTMLIRNPYGLIKDPISSWSGSPYGHIKDPISCWPGGPYGHIKDLIPFWSGSLNGRIKDLYHVNQPIWAHQGPYTMLIRKSILAHQGSYTMPLMVDE